jgi:16S rRNA (cytosine1402-N4)-methyltransferase
MAVNDELTTLAQGLEGAVQLLKTNGRLAVISYHSLEDRIVKQYFKKQEEEGKVEILTKKPIVPGEEEMKENPRSRSAKLRIIQKI